MRKTRKTWSVVVGMAALCGAATVATAGGDAAEKKAPPQAGKPKPPPPDDIADIKVVEPPEAPAIPEPAPELLARARKVKGSWKCKGEMFGPDGSGYRTAFTMKVALDLDSMFLRTDFAEGKRKANPRPMKFTAYTTYDPATKAWRQLNVTNYGSWGDATSSGPDADGAITWAGESAMGGMTARVRDHEDWTDKKTWHLWGEFSMDGGKHWLKAYDGSCKKK